MLTQASKVGAFPLNKAATKAAADAVGESTKTVASALKAKKAGVPGKAVTAIYDTGGSSDFKSATYQGLVFVVGQAHRKERAALGQDGWIEFARSL